MSDVTKILLIIELGLKLFGRVETITAEIKALLERAKNGEDIPDAELTAILQKVERVADGWDASGPQDGS